MTIITYLSQKKPRWMPGGYSWIFKDNLWGIPCRPYTLAGPYVEGELVQPTQFLKWQRQRIAYYKSQTSVQQETNSYTITIMGVVVRGPYMEGNERLVETKSVKDSQRPTLEKILKKRNRQIVDEIDFWE